MPKSHFDLWGCKPTKHGTRATLDSRNQLISSSSVRQMYMLSKIFKNHWERILQATAFLLFCEISVNRGGGFYKKGAYIEAKMVIAWYLCVTYCGMNSLMVTWYWRFKILSKIVDEKPRLLRSRTKVKGKKYIWFENNKIRVSILQSMFIWLLKQWNLGEN